MTEVMPTDRDCILDLEVQVKATREGIAELVSLAKSMNRFIDLNARQIESHAKFIQDILRALPKEFWR